MTYQKRKNVELFKNLENFDLVKTQNYIPIYQNFFSLNDTNYNGINLNHHQYITSVKQKTSRQNTYLCNIANPATQKTKTKTVFFKSAPLLDPFKYLVGKYNFKDETFLTLPALNSTTSTVNSKMLDVNNSAYVDGFFSYLTSQLLHEQKFVHGLEYYGSFLSIKNNFTLNVFDDLEYLIKSDFFNKNKNVLFQVEDYDVNMFKDDNSVEMTLNSDKAKKQIHLNIVREGGDVTLEAETFDDSIFSEIFTTLSPPSTTSNNYLSEEALERNMTEIEDLVFDNDETTSLKSGSSCSSRTSHTDTDTNDEDEEDENEDAEGTGENSGDMDIDESSVDGSGSGSGSSDSEIDSTLENEVINATIPIFPVHLICMENCENTMDDLIIQNELSEVEWFSMLMQIVMTLLTYQKIFAFTHNDLHTNNVMYIKTEKKYLYYCYKKKYYRVPTFGRIFKIIDFGRSIYKFGGKLMCSDSFQQGGDASTQYNIEPYFNDNKPRLEPNYSFDLCRLACSIFDYVVDDLDSIRNLSKCDAITRLIVEWCLDDNGINILYKNNGDDRYPEFKLYKMIARGVHNHTPQAQLERPEFNSFMILKPQIPMDAAIFDLDVYNV